MSASTSARAALHPYNCGASTLITAGRYTLAVVVTCAAALLRWGLTPVIGNRIPFAPFFFAILVSAWFGGLGPGVVSTLLSMAIVAVLWLEPVGVFRTENPDELGALLVAGTVGVGMSMFAEGLRRSGQRLTEARHTAELYASRVALFQTVTTEVSAAANRAKIAEVVATHGRSALGADVGLVAIASDEASGHRFEILYASGADDLLLRRWRTSADGVPAAILCGVHTSPECVLDTLDSDEPAPKGEGEVLAVPMQSDGHAIGVVAFRFPRRQVSDDELQLAKNLAAECALAMDRARLFESEQKARARAERSADAQKELLAVVSHDLRNPLGVIMMTLERISQNAPAAIHHETDLMRRAGDQMNALISDLLDAASLEAGAFRIVRADKVEISALVDESVESARPAAERRSITLEKQITADVELVCHRDRVLQVFGNLISNALRFTPEGGKITVQARSIGKDVEVSVADTGPGIPFDQLVRVFERYARGPFEAARGSGLGLYIAKGIVEAHGGSISVESRPGLGATFRFTLPQRP